MDGLASPLILTKLRVPGARSRTVLRSRLLTQLTSGSPGLVLVCAPAGYGKTTLLAEWARCLQQQSVAVAWYALDASDNTPSNFGAYLVAGLAAALGPASDLAYVAQRLRTSPELDLPGLLPAVINAVEESGCACVLILDDYHLIDAPAVHSALAALIDHLPDNMRIVIGSRSDPPLALARLRSRGRLHEVRAGELRFTADEAAGFLNEVMQLGVSSDLVEALEARTEGWVAGLQLAALSLAGRTDRESFVASFGGSHRYLVEYLMEEVVRGQDDEVQRFLLSTSVLDRLCAPLCDPLVAAGSLDPQRLSPSEAILARLEASNLFLVALDDQSCWYRYHHLFRDFLRGRLQKMAPHRAATLHRAAAEWYGAHGFLREAVSHARQSGDWEYAAGVVEQHCFSMLMRSELSTIYEWCAAFPEEVMASHPLLCIVQSWTLVLGARRQNRARAEARLRQAEAAAAALAATDRAASLTLAEHAATVRSYLSLVPDPALDPRKELELAREQLAQSGDEDGAQFSMFLKIAYAHLALQEAEAAEAALNGARRLAFGARLPYGVLETTYQLARLAQNRGLLDRAADLCREGRAVVLQMISPATSSPTPGSDAGAEVTTRAAVEEILPAVGCLDVVLGCIQLARGRPADAERALLHGLALVSSGTNPYPLAAACVALFRLRQAQGRGADAEAFLTALEEAWPDVAFCTRGLRVVHRLSEAPRDPAVVAEAAAWARGFASEVGNGSDLPSFGMGPLGGAEIYALASLAWTRCELATGNAEPAHSYLQSQLALARSRGLGGRASEFSALIPQVDDRDTSLPQPAPHPRLEAVETLSGRELEVLRLMARGASNQQIADQLVITVGTVKSHINHILGKLSSHNRTEAVARARAERLIDI